MRFAPILLPTHLPKLSAASLLQTKNCISRVKFRKICLIFFLTVDSLVSFNCGFSKSRVVVPAGWYIDTGRVFQHLILKDLDQR